MPVPALQILKQLLLTCLLTVMSAAVYAQSGQVWTAFTDDSTDLVGFKDPTGKIMIAPKFMGYTIARRFDKIMAAMEEQPDGYKTYYLTKAGKKVAHDSLYSFDNGPDCESEGFIRFRDPKTGFVGMLNSRGEVSIPAVYNGLSRVANGLVYALQGATKKHWDEDKHSGCNHFSWVGGQTYLLDTLNQVLIKDFSPKETINMYSLKISPTPVKEPFRLNFKASNGRYYSFIGYEQEFRQWLAAIFTTSLTKEQLVAHTYPNIFYWKEPDGWVGEKNSIFMDRNFDLLKNKLLALQHKGAKYSISFGGLNQFMYEGAEFAAYYNNCGEAREEQFPVISIITDHTKKGNFVQDHFDFFRTPQGYRLLNVSLNSEELE